MPKILIVEDDKLLLKVYRVNFFARGFEVDVAIDGEEARQKIQAGRYDLVLLDLELPKLTGRQLLRMIKEHKLKVAQKPIVILSNIDEIDVVKETMSLGATAYLFKDKLDPQGVVSEVGKYLN